MYHCFRLHRGDDLYESIQRYADAHHIAAGVVLSAVGCVYRWELRDAMWRSSRSWARSASTAATCTRALPAVT